MKSCKEIKTMTDTTKQTKNMRPDYVRLLNVRMRYGALFTARTFNESGQQPGQPDANQEKKPAKYDCMVLIPKVDATGITDRQCVYMGERINALDGLNRIKKHLIRQAKGDNAVDGPEEQRYILDPARYAVKDGDLSNKLERRGHWCLQGKNLNQPYLCDKNPSKVIKEEDKLLYGGCWVNALFSFYFLKEGKTKAGNFYPDGLFARIEGVQFVRHDEAFGPPTADETDFDDERTEEERQSETSSGFEHVHESAPVSPGEKTGTQTYPGDLPTGNQGGSTMDSVV